MCLAAAGSHPAVIGRITRAETYILFHHPRRYRFHQKLLHSLCIYYTMPELTAFESEQHPLPPTPPPLPLLPSSSFNDGESSNIKLKVRNDHPPSWPCQMLATSPGTTTPAPTGPYFFYGTLMDPRMLSEVLGLREDEQQQQQQQLPILRPGYITGYYYSRRLWGQYPALVVREGNSDDSDSTGIIEGMVYTVRTVDDAQKLAAYETGNYGAQSCVVIYTDGKEPAREAGSVFVFCGDGNELQEGRFDLGEWLRRMGR